MEREHFESKSNEAKEKEQHEDKSFKSKDGFDESDFLQKNGGFNESDFLNKEVENERNGFNEDDFLNKEQFDSKEKEERTVEDVKKTGDYLSLAVGGPNEEMLEIAGEAVLENKKNESDQENNEIEDDSFENRERLKEKDLNLVELPEHQERNEEKKMDDFHESESFQLDESSWKEASIEEKRDLLNKYHQELHEKLGIEGERKDIRFYINVHTEKFDSSYHQGRNEIELNQKHFDDFDKVISSLSRETYKAYMFQEMNKSYRGEPCDERAAEWGNDFYGSNYEQSSFREDADAFAQEQVERLHQQTEIVEELDLSDVNEKNRPFEDLVELPERQERNEEKKMDDFHESESFQLDESSWKEASIEEKRDLLNKYHQELHEKLGIEGERKDIRFYINVHTEKFDSSYHQGRNEIELNQKHFDDFDKVISSLSRETYKAYMFQEMYKSYRGDSCDERATEWGASFFEENLRIAENDYRKNAFKEDADAFAQEQVERMHQQTEIVEELDFSDVNKKNRRFEELQQDYHEKFATSIMEVEEAKDWEHSSFEERKNLMKRAFTKAAENEMENPPRLMFEAPNNGDVIKGDQIIIGEYNKDKNEMYVHPLVLGMDNDEIARECAAHGLASRKFYEERQKESESDQHIEQFTDVFDESQKRDHFIGKEMNFEFDEFMERDAKNIEARNEFDEFMERDEGKLNANAEFEEFMDKKLVNTEDQTESDNLSEQEAFSNEWFKSSTSLWDRVVEIKEQRLEQAREQVDEAKWADKSLEEKKAAIEHVGEYISTELLNLKDPPTIAYYYEDPKEGSYGYYNKRTNTVSINQFFLESDVQETVDTLGHELKHAKQYEMKEDWDRTQRFKMFRSRVENRVRSLLANPNFEPVKDWSYNLGKNIFGRSRYIQHSEEREVEYESQPVEVDANNYGAKIRKMFFGKKKR